MSEEKVNHPSHYNVGKIEVINAIEEWQLDFALGNAVKYIARAGHKGGTPQDAIDDLDKAVWYISWEAEKYRKLLKAEKEKGNEERAEIQKSGV